MINEDYGDTDFSIEINRKNFTLYIETNKEFLEKTIPVFIEMASKLTNK